MAEEVSLSGAEIQMMLRSARRGALVAAGQQRSAAASAALTGSLTLLGGMLWCADLLTLLKG